MRKNSNRFKGLWTKHAKIDANNKITLISIDTHDERFMIRFEFPVQVLRAKGVCEKKSRGCLNAKKGKILNWNEICCANNGMNVLNS